MITFNRNSVSSSFRAYRKADRLLKSGISIVVFPEGGVPVKNVRLGKFKPGAFKLAIHNQVSIIPITFIDNKNKHPEDELKLRLGFLRVCIHAPISTKGMQAKDSKTINQKVFSIINKTLIDYENK